MPTRQAVLTIALAVAAASEAAEPKFPPGTVLMPARTVRLAVDEQTFTSIDFPPRPAVVGDLVNLIPGEKIWIEAEEKDGALKHLKLVSKNKHPATTLEIEFTQTPDRANPMMVLRIKNPFRKKLLYSSEIQPLGEQRFQSTSNIGVKPGLESFESWPGSITRILLREFRLTNEE